MEEKIVAGTAGWTLPAAVRDRFGPGGSQLERYATRLNGTEINSSFYRPHRRTTYERWAAATPPNFQFAVKMPREITHLRRFIDIIEPLERFLDESAGLGEKRAIVLVQLPPSFAFDATLVRAFLEQLRARYAGGAVCEPRHATWANQDAADVLAAFAIDRVITDPVAAAGLPERATGLRYLRLHGSPRMYYDAYPDERIASFARDAASADRAWVIFDNTAAGHATANALALRGLTHAAVAEG